MNRLHRPARTALAGSRTLAVLALGLTACGGDDDAQAAPAPATVTVTEDAEARLSSTSARTTAGSCGRSAATSVPRY